MKNLKEKVKLDLTNKLDIDLKYDKTHILENESKTKKNLLPLKIALISVTCSIVMVFAVPILMIGLQTHDSFKMAKKQYSIHEIENIENNSFKSLNKITYPSAELKENIISESFKNGYNNFSYQTYKNLNKQDNFAYSPASLYSNLSLLSLASNDETINETIDEILGVSKENRNNNYKYFYENNYYANELGTTQMYSGVFLSNQYEVNQQFINSLTNYYAEAYSLDFTNSKDVNKMMSWVDQKVDSENFIDPSLLNLDDTSAFVMMSTMYFNNKWYSSYDIKNSYEDIFVTSNKANTQATFMNHEYFGDLYEYESYVAVYDKYTNDRKIIYIVPKNISDNIYELTKDVDILKDDESKLLVNKETLEPILIDLHLPKFNASYIIDFKETLSNMGLSKMYDSDSKSFNNAFTNLNDRSIYLQSLMQKNEISFNEDGTTIKSVSFSLGAGAAGPMPELDTYIVKLNQPFIYVIYDNQDMPIFIGHVDNV